MYYDKNFLKQLDEHRTRVVYARIIALTLEEVPVETIEGRVTEGSINIDGDSSVRRTCSLTMVAQDFNYNEFLWGLNTKFKLEIGLENHIDSSYPSIIWFPQGTYIISDFNTAHSTNNFSISIQGKDKMSALNGELGGTFTSSCVFDTVDDIITLDGGETMVKRTKLPVRDIIKNVVWLYGGEPLHNIIINDLDTTGLELLEYRYSEDTPLYLYREATIDSPFLNVTLDKNKVCEIVADINDIDPIVKYIHTETGARYASLDDFETTEEQSKLRLFVLNDLLPNELQRLINPFVGSDAPVIVRFKNEIFNQETNTYSDYNAHIAKIEFGETAGYRYTDLTYPGDLIGAVGESITSILDKIKNILGDFEYFYNLDGQFVFQRKRYSFDSTWTPLLLNEYGQQIIDADNHIDYTFSDSALVTTFNNNPNLSNVKNDYSVWGTRQSLSGQAIAVHMRYALDKKPVYYKNLAGTEFTINDWDWREIIYQMALDYTTHTNDDELENKIAAANLEYYPSGKTGYEHYYTDLLDMWRNLYNPEAAGIEVDGYYADGPYKYWNATVYLAPQNLNKWFDFLDTEGELSRYSIKNIGCRPKVVNDSDVKAIYFREVPNILFTTDYANEINRSSSYTYIQMTEELMANMFAISSQGKSAKSAIDELLYVHSYCIASTTINTIPIYYLEPNSKVHIVDAKAQLEGYYNISKLSIPLKYDGTMSITATKAAETI